MISTKQKLVYLLRKFHLLQTIDDLRYLVSLKNTWRINKAFIKEQPDFKFPPSFLAYDAYGHTNWPVYYYTGIAHAKYISQLIKDNLENKALAICEWGCGPARILRHMPNFSEDRKFNLYGFDYNSRTIKWCREQIEGITFDCNSTSPPLPCDSNTFDCVYNLSVFTHLSKDMHFQWINELQRIVKPGGLIIITTHGDNFKNNLVENELRDYEKGQIVIRGEIEEGKRCYVAYHPEHFISHELLKNGLEVISHHPGPVLESLPQDVWVIRNNKTD